MRIFLTGGCGDLGKLLAYSLEKRGDIALRYDIKSPTDSFGTFIQGSILERRSLLENLVGTDVIVHIAAWHGIHEFTKQKNVYDFWDLNVTGTFNIFQAASDLNIKNVILISSEGVAETTGMYGWTKVLSEQIAQRFFDNHLNVLTLRPRAFIPYWNHEVYKSFIEWARWYWKGAVHINDVAQAIINGIDLLMNKSLKQHLILPVDGAYEYTQDDLLNWDLSYSGETFKKYYEKYYDLVIRHGLDPSLTPTIQDISETKKYLRYIPTYSLNNLLADLEQYGEKGPPVSWNK
jgi:nucleoside-diphosphate-sugar epimerase